MAKYLGNRPTAVPLTSADIEDGTIQNVDINDVAATKLTGSIADARIPASAVTQHVTEFDDTKLRQDISALALHSAVADNKTAHNLPNTFIEQFQDDTGIATETNVDRSTDEFVSSIVEVSVAKQGTLESGANISGSQGKFGGYSLELDGISDRCDFSSHDDFAQNTGDYTMEAWYKFSNNSSQRVMWSGSGSESQGYRNLNYRGDSGTKKFQHRIWTGSSVVYEHNVDINTGQWYHLASVWSGGNSFKFFIDGTCYIAETPSYTQPNEGIHIGAMNNYLNNDIGFVGYIDEFRISNSARYSADFTPSTSAFSVDSNTILLCHFDSDQHSEATTTTTTSATGTLISNASVSDSAQTKVSGVALYKDNYGTATLGTDLKIYFSCDNGSNWTEAASYGTVSPLFSTGVKMVRLGETTCTSGTQIKYKVEWANQSADTKETQLHGMGMNY